MGNTGFRKSAGVRRAGNESQLKRRTGESAFSEGKQGEVAVGQIINTPEGQMVMLPNGQLSPIGTSGGGASKGGATSPVV